MKNILKLLTIADKGLIVGLVIISVVSFPLIHQCKPKGKTLIIQANGRVVHKLDLLQSRTVEIKGKIGRTTVRIEKGAAWVESSDCPQKICMQMGKISHSGEMVICVPNKVLLYVAGKRRRTYDAITE